MIFRSGFISSSRTSSRLRLFYEFFYLKACEESGGGIFEAGKVGRDLKSNVTGFIKGARGVMVNVAGVGHGDTSSSPGRD